VARRNRWHDDLMDGYYCAREAWEREAEAVTLNYETELAEYKESNPPPTFRMWLIENRQRESV
jgi:hypothetical protein